MTKSFSLALLKDQHTSGKQFTWVLPESTQKKAQELKSITIDIDYRIEQIKWTSMIFEIKC